MDNEEEKVEEKKEIKMNLKAVIIIDIIIVLAIVGIIVFLTNLFNRDGSSSCNKINGANSSYRNSVNEDIPITDRRIIGYKPIIYLYPEKTTELSVQLGKPKNLTCSYPKYENGWNIIANPDGTLIDKNTGRKLYSLYWEGIYSEPINFDEGFVVKGSEVIDFLEEKLEILGLNEYEAEEFIVYWLPKLEQNKYNYIRFATIDEINKSMPLEFSVKPDTIIRILMQFKALDNNIEIKEQKLETPERKGFVAVEWGGTEIK